MGERECWRRQDTNTAEGGGENVTVFKGGGGNLTSCGGEGGLSSMDEHRGGGVTGKNLIC